MLIRSVLIEEKCLARLKKLGLDYQYKKAKAFILADNLASVRFKKRQPYGAEKYYFRLNRQYRAICYFADEYTIHIFEIDDHQN
jgi:hypothetical protein